MGSRNLWTLCGFWDHFCVNRHLFTWRDERLKTPHDGLRCWSLALLSMRVHGVLVAPNTRSCLERLSLCGVDGDRSLNHYVE